MPGHAGFTLVCSDSNHQLANGTDPHYDTPGHVMRPEHPWPATRQNRDQFLLCSAFFYVDTFITPRLCINFTTNLHDPSLADEQISALQVAMDSRWRQSVEKSHPTCSVESKAKLLLAVNVHSFGTQDTSQGTLSHVLHDDKRTWTEKAGQVRGCGGGVKKKINGAKRSKKKPLVFQG